MLVTFVLAFAACGSDPPAKTPTGARVSCSHDDDCEVTTFSSCCACCPTAPYASPKGELAQKKQACDPKKCTACSEDIECPAVSKQPLVAHCRSGACAAEVK
jgi:hypothetical protein